MEPGTAELYQKILGQKDTASGIDAGANLVESWQELVRIAQEEADKMLASSGELTAAQMSGGHRTMDGHWSPHSDGYLGLPENRWRGIVLNQLRHVILGATTRQFNGRWALSYVQVGSYMQQMEQDVVGYDRATGQKTTSKKRWAVRKLLLVYRLTDLDSAPPIRYSHKGEPLEHTEPAAGISDALRALLAKSMEAKPAATDGTAPVDATSVARLVTENAALNERLRRLEEMLLARSPAANVAPVEAEDDGDGVEIPVDMQDMQPVTTPPGAAATFDDVMATLRPQPQAPPTASPTRRGPRGKG